MAWPPTIPAANITNTTEQNNRHPADHNALSAALPDIVDFVAVKSANITDITAASNFEATLNMRRSGQWAVMSVTLSRSGGNIAAGEAVIGTVAAAGRGSFAGFTQALTLRSTTSPAALQTAICWFNAQTGQITLNWQNTWNTGVGATFTGVVFLGS
jgi:hypothetical protein